MIQPVMVIGLGAAGVLALDEIAHGLQQAYGSAVKDSVMLMAFTLGQETPQHAWIETSSRFEGVALADWAKTTPRALKHWFDAPYHLRPNRLKQLSQTFDERQVARARFVAQLAQDANDELKTFFEARRDRLLSVANGHTLIVYLLADSDDPNTALLLDIANLVSVVFKGESLYLMLHLALSSSWLTDAPTPDRAYELARSFAILREISRFTTSYGATQHTVYADGSGLEDYNAIGSAIITGVKVYHAASPQTLAQVWADALLPQMERPLNRERSAVGFGSHYEQFNIANWHSLRQNRVDKSGQRYSLYAGGYDTYTALFPKAQLQQHWAARLSHDALRDWLGDTPPDNDSVLGGLLETSWRDAHGEVYCPHTVALLAAITPQDIERIETLETLLYREEAKKRGSNPDFTLLANDYQSYLTWQPDIDTIQGYGLGAFTKHTADDLERHTDGYAQALAVLTEATDKRFARALSAYLTHHLTDAQGAGIRTVYSTVARLFTQIQHAHDLLTQEIRRPRNPNTLNKQRDEIRWAAGRVEQFRGGLRRQLTRELLTYVNLVGELWAAQRYQIALTHLHSLTARLFKTLESLYNALNHWADVLWKSPESLLPQVAARAAQAITLDAHPQRLWLYDEQWQRETYEKRLAPQLMPPLRENLRWTFNTVNETWIPYLGYHVADEQEALAWWFNESASQVAQARVDLWNDYLLPNQTYQRRLQDIRALFAQPQSMWPKESSMSEDLILPKTLVGTAQGMDSQLLNLLREQDRMRIDVYESEDTTRLVRYVSREVFGLFEMPAYQEAQQAYQALDQERRARLHVLAAECEAVHWESLSKRLLHGQSILFENSVVALLTHQPKLEQFIWLNALKLVSIQAYDNERHYELALPHGAFFWLDDTGASLLEAVTNFVFKANLASFKEKPTLGRPQNILQNPLPPSDALDDIITHTLNQRVEHGETVYHDDLQYRYRRLRRVPQAVQQIERAQVLHEYDTALESRIKTDAARFNEEQQLLILLRLIAEERYIHYRQRIDSWV